MVNGESAFVSSGPLRLWTERSGDPRDPAVLLVMGTAAQGIMWPDALVGALVDGGLQVLRFDHRDTGRSSCVSFRDHPYTLADMAADALAVLDGHGLRAAHIVGASLGGRIGQFLAVHHRERVLTLTTIMTTPMGIDPGPAWARARAGLPPGPTELPPPAPEFFRHLASLAAAPPVTREDRIAAAVKTFRVIHGTGLPFDEDAARRYAAAADERARDGAAARNHDAAGRQPAAGRLAPLTGITAPALVIHGTADPLLPVAHGRALAMLIPGARFEPVPGMGHGFFSPGLPRRVAGLILGHIAAAQAPGAAPGPAIPG